MPAHLVQHLHTVAKSTGCLTHRVQAALKWYLQDNLSLGKVFS